MDSDAFDKYSTRTWGNVAKVLNNIEAFCVSCGSHALTYYRDAFASGFFIMDLVYG